MLSETKRILKEHGLRPVHYRGQNFLISKKVFKKIIKTAQLTKDDIVLEVGPGLGFLTKELARRVKKVIAVEIDKNLVQILKEELKDYKNVIIINKNILKISPDEFKAEIDKVPNPQFPIPNSKYQIYPQSQIPDSRFPIPNYKNYKIVANLPYHITSRFLRQFLEGDIKPEELVLMVQKEVAERITARPGKMSLLAVSCQFYADCQIVGLVGRKNFWPSPRVDSAIIKLKVKREKYKVDEEKFFKIVRAGFRQKRKKLVTNLTKELSIDKKKILALFQKLGIPEDARAQDLSVEEWVSLVASDAVT